MAKPATTRATESENRFLDHLGNWSPDFQRNRLELLKSYLAAAERRDDWAGIDSKSIIKRVRSEIGD